MWPQVRHAPDASGAVVGRRQEQPASARPAQPQDGPRVALQSVRGGRAARWGCAVCCAGARIVSATRGWVWSQFGCPDQDVMEDGACSSS